MPEPTGADSRKDRGESSPSNKLFVYKLCHSQNIFNRSRVSPAGGGQQPGAGGSVQRAGQHGPGAAAGRCDAAVSAPEHPGPQRQRRRRKKEQKNCLFNLGVVEKHDLCKCEAATLTLNLVHMKLFDINQMKLDDIS